MNTHLSTFQRFTISLLGLFLIVYFMIIAKSLLVPVLISAFLAVLITPVANWLEKYKTPRILAVAISMILLSIVLFAILYFFYNQFVLLARDLGEIEQRVNELIISYNQLITTYLDNEVPVSLENIKDTIFSYLYANASTLTQGIASTASSLAIVFMMPVFIFLFLLYRDFLEEFLLMSFSVQSQEKVKHVLGNVKKVVQNYISGMFVVICILAVLNSIALLSLGIKHALFFAVFAAFLNVIPFLGPLLGATLPIAYAILTKDSLWYPIGVFLAFYIIQLMESNLFTPKIVGGKVSMNPMLTIIILFVGNMIWGVAGMVLFIPAMAILKEILNEIPGMESWAFLLGDTKKQPAPVRSSLILPPSMHRFAKRWQKKP